MSWPHTLSWPHMPDPPYVLTPYPVHPNVLTPVHPYVLTPYPVHPKVSSMRLLTVSRGSWKSKTSSASHSSSAAASVSSCAAPVFLCVACISPTSGIACLCPNYIVIDWPRTFHFNLVSVFCVCWTPGLLAVCVHILINFFNFVSVFWICFGTFVRTFAVSFRIILILFSSPCPNGFVLQSMSKWFCSPIHVQMVLPAGQAKEHCSFINKAGYSL